MKNKITSSFSQYISIPRILFAICISISLFSTRINAQTTVQIGFDTLVSPSTTYGPIYRYSATSATRSAHSNMLFTASAMAAAGIPSGATITTVEFFKVNAANFTTPITHSMYMANTLNTGLANTLTWAAIQGSHTLVFTDASFNVPNSSGWISWNISPFTYTGGALEIAAEQVMTANGGATDKIQWRYSPGIATDKLVGATSTSVTPPATLNGTVTAYRTRPNIRITFTPPLSTTAVNGQFLFEPFPNPAHQELIVSISGAQMGSILKLMSISGQVFYTQSIVKTTTQQQLKIDLNGIAKGVYFLKLEGGESNLQRKVIID